MKINKLFAIGMLALMLAGCGKKEKAEAEEYGSETEAGCVYICTGGQSRRYHSVEDCPGLRRCSREVREITVDEAEEAGRTPCRFCH